MKNNKLRRSIFCYTSIILLIFTVVPISYSVSLNENNIDENRLVLEDEKFNQAEISTEYTNSSSMYIGGDSWFEYNGMPGSGTEIDPYIVENYFLNSSATTGISIDHTTVHFIIRNCYFNSTGYGIKVKGVVSNTLEINNNTFSKYCDGLKIENAPGIKIIDNKFLNNGFDFHGYYVSQYPSYEIVNNTINGRKIGFFHGKTLMNITEDEYGQIFLVGCSNSTIANQTLGFAHSGLEIIKSDYITVDNISSNNNKDYGIIIEDSQALTVRNSEFHNNEREGVRVLSSPDCSFINNSFVNSGLLFFSIWPSVIEGNTMNGRLMEYFEGVSDLHIDVPIYGQLFLSDCSNIILENQNLSYTTYGIRTNWCNNITVRNSNCSNNSRNGIFIQNSDNCIIENNNCSNNSWHGIYVENGLYNAYTNNTCSENEQAGIIVTSSNQRYDSETEEYIYSSYFNIIDNTVNKNHQGVMVNDWSHNFTLLNNTICENNHFGIYIEYSDDFNISYNYICSNRIGIFIYHLYSEHLEVENRQITFNWIIANRDAGVYIWEFRIGCLIHHNNFIDNNLNGSTSYHNTVISQCYDSEGSCQWYDKESKQGNFWSDYKGRGRYIIDNDNNDKRVFDKYPLKSYANYTDYLIALEEASFSLQEFIICLTTICLVHFLRKRNKSS